QAGVAAAVRRSLWVLRDGRPQELSVTLGISDGRYTEVSGAGLEAGVPVITDQRAAAP
ncbi:efflux RND transporter periplasmic adaptor subunit, partial [Rugamonas sp. FT82W]|nr:efflux RND transporter periplasmic adaptor subunit [Duganella vulcania]